jgi:hypothetical protein
MNNPLSLFHTEPASAASNTEVRAASRAAGTADHPAPEIVGFEIGVILAVTLGIAYAVPLLLSVCGIE